MIAELDDKKIGFSVKVVALRSIQCSRFCSHMGIKSLSQIYRNVSDVIKAAGLVE